MSIIDIILVIGTCLCWFAAGVLGASGSGVEYHTAFVAFSICGCFGIFYIITDILVPDELNTTNLGE